jgi:hypothetical protein
VSACRNCAGDRKAFGMGREMAEAEIEGLLAALAQVTVRVFYGAFESPQWGGNRMVRAVVRALRPPLLHLRVRRLQRHLSEHDKALSKDIRGR